MIFLISDIPFPSLDSKKPINCMLNHHQALIPLFPLASHRAAYPLLLRRREEYYKYASDRESRQRRKGRARGCCLRSRFNGNNANINQKGLEMRLCMGLYEE
jgi:hypothetical protein